VPELAQLVTPWSTLLIGNQIKTDFLATMRPPIASRMLEICGRRLRAFYTFFTSFSSVQLTLATTSNCDRNSVTATTGCAHKSELDRPIFNNAETTSNPPPNLFRLCGLRCRRTKSLLPSC